MLCRRYENPRSAAALGSVAEADPAARMRALHRVVNIGTGAVPDPGVLVDCLWDGFAEITALG